ncbi:MAG: hypothetical protein HY390_02880 [Deltaproteobacteria bacterium]|nr:hypothetical protein [Deltaproteobacteria bacterium]
MNRRIVLSLIFSLGLLPIALFAQGETELLYEVSQLEVEPLSATVDFQWIQGIQKIESPQWKAETQYGKVHVGMQYLFSDITRFALDVPFGLLYSMADYSGVNGKKMSTAYWILDRIRGRVDATVFPETTLGEISWNAQVFIPSMMGNFSREQQFYNHWAIGAGLQNLYWHPSVPLFVRGALSYLYKAESSYQNESRTYGDEVSGSLGVGYSVHSQIHPMVSFQASYVNPLEQKMPNASYTTEKGAYAFHVVPVLSIPITYNLTVHGISRVLVYRSKISKMATTSSLWGNFEDEGTLSVMLGVRLGLF